MMGNWDVEQTACDHGAQAGGNAERIILVGGQDESATFESGLADKALSKFVRGRLVRGVPGEGADAAKVDGRGVVGQIEAAVEERKAFGDSGEQASGEGGKTLRRIADEEQ